jgi:hypothetical protein
MVGCMPLAGLEHNGGSLRSACNAGTRRSRPRHRSSGCRSAGPHKPAQFPRSAHDVAETLNYRSGTTNQRQAIVRGVIPAGVPIDWDVGPGGIVWLGVSGEDGGRNRHP